MIASDKSINAWQTSIFIFVLMFANKVLILPSLLFEGAKMESLFVVVVLSVLELGLLYVFYLLKNRFPNQSFSYVLKNHCSKIVMWSIYFLFMVYFLSKAILMYNITYIFFKTVIYKDGDNFLFLVCLLPIINHLSCCGLRTMGRTLQLFFPVVILLVSFCVLVGFFGINSTPLLFQSSISELFLTTIRHISAFGDMIFLFVFMNKIQIKKGQWKIVFSVSAISLFLVILVTLVFMLSYTYTAFMHPFALFEIMNYVKEFGGTGRIDILSMIVIIVMTYFHLAIYLKSFMACFQTVFYKIDKVYSVITFNLLFLFLVTFVVQNLEVAVFFGENILPYLSIFSFVLLPIFSIFCHFKRKRRDKA